LSGLKKGRPLTLSREKTSLNLDFKYLVKTPDYYQEFFSFGKRLNNMKVKGKTILNIAIMVVILSFFVTPLGDYSKVMLNRIFSFSPTVTKEVNRENITDYNWRLKDENWDFFNFKESEGRVVFVNFWRSWKLPSHAELESIQKLYDAYKDKVDFYIITNEEKEPVEKFMQERNFTFPVTYSVVGDSSPLSGSNPPRSYLLDKEGNIIIQKEGVADWDNADMYKLLNSLLAK